LCSPEILLFFFDARDSLSVLNMFSETLQKTAENYCKCTKNNCMFIAFFIVIKGLLTK